MGTPNTASALIRYLETLTCTQGQGAGDPLEVLPWQRRFIRGAFSGPGDAALSVARGNGKTTLLAGVAAAFVNGPLRQPRAEVVIIAASLAQGKISFSHTRAFLEASGCDLTARKLWKCHDGVNSASIEHRPSGSRVRVIGSDPKRAHGLAPALILADEPAQWPPNTAEAMVAALKTARGKIPGAKMIALGTRPAEPDHWYQRMLDGQGVSYAQSHAVPSGTGDAMLGQRGFWRKANPSLGFMPDLEAAIRDEWSTASRDPSLLASFKALRLNMGVPDVLASSLLEAETWRRIEAPEGQGVERRGPWALGVDLGSTAAMSAVAGYWPETGALTALACFPADPPLADRGRQDGVADLYVRMAERGELIIAGRYVSEVPALLREVVDRWGVPDVIVSDRWRLGELRQALEAAGMPRTALATRGQGYFDGGADVREFRKQCASLAVRPDVSLLLRAAMAEARVQTDAAANAKLAKGSEGGRRRRARDDAAAAAILAVAEGTRRAGTGTGTGDSDGTPRRRLRVCA